MSDEREKLTPAQLLGIGGFVALAIGAHIYREAAKSPQRRAEDGTAHRARHHAKRDYEDRRHKAWKMDQDHWAAFEADPAAQAGFAAEYYVPVSVGRALGSYSEERGGSLWDTWISYRMT